MNIKNDHGQTPLTIALYNNNYDVATLLLDKGAQPDTVISDAIKKDIPIELVQRLIKKGANVNHESDNGYTPLLKAARFNNHEAAKLLLDNDANQSLIANDRTTAILWATSNNRPQMLELLLDHTGTDNWQEFINQGDSYNQTALFHAVEKGMSIELVQLLIKKGANVNHKSNNGYTPLLKAARFNNHEAAKLLLDNDANQSLIANDRTTAILWATSNNHPQMLELLLKHKGTDNWKDFINQGDSYNQTALFYAVRNGMPIELVQLLINKGADVNKGAILDQSLINDKHSLSIMLLQQKNINISHYDFERAEQTRNESIVLRMAVLDPKKFWEHSLRRGHHILSNIVVHSNREQAQNMSRELVKTLSGTQGYNDDPKTIVTQIASILNMEPITFQIGKIENATSSELLHVIEKQYSKKLLDSTSLSENTASIVAEYLV